MIGSCLLGADNGTTFEKKLIMNLKREEGVQILPLLELCAQDRFGVHVFPEGVHLIQYLLTIHDLQLGLTIAMLLPLTVNIFYVKFDRWNTSIFRLAEVGASPQLKCPGKIVTSMEYISDNKNIIVLSLSSIGSH